MDGVDILQAHYFEISDVLVAKTLKCYDTPDSEFDSTQLEMGTKIEKEHTNSTLVAKTIAKAHLKEIPDYYTRLEKMEKEAKLPFQEN